MQIASTRSKDFIPSTKGAALTSQDIVVYILQDLGGCKIYKCSMGAEKLMGITVCVCQTVCHNGPWLTFVSQFRS
jgi:hypothetical protein